MAKRTTKKASKGTKAKKAGAAKKAKTTKKARVTKKTGATKKPAASSAAKKAAASGATKWSAAQKRDFDKIIGRAKELSPTLSREDFDREGNPVPGPWANMLGDLDAWAKKYKVKVKTTEYKSGSGQPATGGLTTMAHHSCPGTTHSTEHVDFVGGGGFTIEHTCTLKRQTWLGRCVYSCIGNIVS
jgi:hypothetical protein